MKTVVLAILLSALTTPVNAQWLNHTAPGIPRTADGKPNLKAPAPRTPDGKPDLSGLWNKISPKYGNNITADFKPEEVPAWVQALVQQRHEELGKDYMTALCLPLGPGYATGERYMKFVQTPALIVILDEDLTYRQIFMDGRALEKDPNPSWMGYSVGHWAGDTLVVESNGFNDRTWLDAMGHPHTEALRITERYQRRDFGHLEQEVTIQDPSVYAKPWTVAVESLAVPDTELIEQVCAENNKGVGHWVGKASDDQKAEVKVAPEILAKYTGTYVEQPKFWRSEPRSIEITFSGGALFGNIGGRGPVRLYALSETDFSGLQWGIEFIPPKDGQGATTGLYTKHVSGLYKFARTK
jgi:hypothetical protein